MTITLTQQESEKYFHSSLCNGANYILGHGIQISFEDADYKKAQKSLQAKLDKGEIPHEMYVHKGDKPSACIEDVLMEILRNGDKLELIDEEGDGEYTRKIGLAEVHERVQKTPLDHLNDMIQENDDATTADVILQTVFLEDVIFG